MKDDESDEDHRRDDHSDHGARARPGDHEGDEGDRGHDPPGQRQLAIPLLEDLKLRAPRRDAGLIGGLGIERHAS